MFDFFGLISFETRPKVNIGEPFQYLNEIENVDFRLENVNFDDNYFLLANRKEGVDNSSIFLDEEFFLLLYGTCYTKLACQAFNEKKKLTAIDLAGLYKEKRDGFTEMVKGSFAIAIIDRKKRSAKIFTDPLNLQSVYYQFLGTKLVVSSSLKALINYLSDCGQTPKINLRAVLDQYLFDFILDDHTYIQNIKEIPAGSILQLVADKLSVIGYFDSFSRFNLSGPEMNSRDGAEALKELMTKNIDLYSEGPDQTAVALTGGFDSRSVLALLGKKAKNYELYSYGKKESWDLKIPQLIADRLQLNYSPIFLDKNYENVFAQNAKMAVLLGDGTTQFSQANIAYVYSNFLNKQTSVLTGLFGSELIKIPSSRGLFIDQNMISLLNSRSLVSCIKNLLNQIKEKGPILPFFGRNQEEELVEMLDNHPFINNDLPRNEKYFHYLLMVGIRKYFQQEIKIQRIWKTNLHPYFDLEFINLLLKTPFPWVYNFSQKKSLVKNIAIHKLYATMIHANPILSGIMSTHGYRPRNLLNKFRLPFLAMEYYTYKKKISRSSSQNFQKDLSFDYIQKNKNYIWGDSNFDTNKILKLRTTDQKNFISLASLQYWFTSIGLSL